MSTDALRVRVCGFEVGLASFSVRRQDLQGTSGGLQADLGGREAAHPHTCPTALCTPLFVPDFCGHESFPFR
jgi:hypothetical protein